MRDPADIEEQRRVEDSIEAAAIGMEVAAIAVIARRLGNLEGKSLAEIYASMPSDIAEIQDAIKTGTESIKRAAVESMDGMASANDEWAKRYYDYRGVEQLSAAEHKEMSSVLKTQTEAATAAIDAKCRSTVVRVGNELLPLAPAYNTVITDAAISMQTGAKAVDQAISQAVKALSRSGLRVVYASGATRNLYSAVSMNVMDAYRVAMSEMREIQGQEFGADGVEVSAHALCAEDHQKYQGIQYSYDKRRGYDRWEDVQYEPARPLVTGANCVIEGTKVDMSGAAAIFRRHYEGKIVRIRTSLGNELSVTPNHPILTMRGWVAAKDIQKGDNVISGGFLDGISNGVRPYNQNYVAPIEDCFSSASHKFDVFDLPSSPADFHGDGIVDQKVDVVFIDSELRGNAQTSVSEHVVQSLLHDASSLSDSSLGSGSLTQRFMGLMASPDSIMSGGSNGTSLFSGHSRHSIDGGIPPSRRDGVSVFCKNPSNSKLIDSKSLANASLGHAAFVKGHDSGNVILDDRLSGADSVFLEAGNDDLEGNADLSSYRGAGSPLFSSLDNVVDVNVDSWNGHVYNLSTNCGYYLANGIITHNCGHVVFPVLLGISEPAYSKKELRELKRRSNEEVTFTGLSGKPLTMSRYDASQYQRQLETTIRKTNQDAYLFGEAKATKDAAAAKAMAKSYTAQYKRISSEAGLSTRMERTRAYVQK